MSKAEKPEVGTILWRDLTVGNAAEIRDFYCDVVGWNWTPVDMKSYEDFDLNAPVTGATAGRICQAQGENATMPAQWMVYVAVADLERCMKRCGELGGKVIHGPRTHESTQFCVIRDPAGAGSISTPPGHRLPSTTPPPARGRPGRTVADRVRRAGSPGARCLSTASRWRARTGFPDPPATRNLLSGHSAERRVRIMEIF